MIDYTGVPYHRQHRCILSARVAATLVNHGKDPFSFQITQVFLSLLGAVEDYPFGDNEPKRRWRKTWHFLVNNHFCRNCESWWV
ncbi:Transmembrane protein 53-A [Fusarium oxysporum f. sp. albedinis]|nr:Transmembrane protein 53-A [Fusarium oxysporum f. sp. albedinis]